MGHRCRIDELDAVVDSLMRVTLSTEIVVSSPGIADDRTAGFYPVTYYGHQCVGGSVRNGHKECFAGLSFNTTKHRLTLNRVSVWYLRRPNLLSSISTVVLGPPIVTEQPSRNTSMVSLQNMPPSVTVCGPRRYSLRIHVVFRGARCRM